MDQVFLVSVSAFLGALLSMILVYRISTSGGKTNVVMMLLSGVAITAIGFAIRNANLHLQRRPVERFNLLEFGKSGFATWTKNAILFGVLLISYYVLLPKGKALNAMIGRKRCTAFGDQRRSSEKADCYSHRIDGGNLRCIFRNEDLRD
jgi:iron complex transport system permease protein